MQQGTPPVAIITGAGTGIGRATATALGRRGWRCVLIGRRAAPLDTVAAEVREAGGEGRSAALDVTDEDAVTAMAGETARDWGRIDLLVNNAGLNVPQRDLNRITPADWRRVVDADLTGPFLVTQAVLTTMRAQGEGTIVNVSSMAAIRSSQLSGPAYSAAKAGLNSFTEGINVAERVHGIRACAVCPGEVDTPILEKRPYAPSAAARATMLQAEDVAEVIILVATLPVRAAVELVLMRPTILRDITEERRLAEQAVGRR